MDRLLRRKIDDYLTTWKSNPQRKPLIVKGARQIGKTRSIEWFASQHYKNVVQINFVEQPKYRAIFPTAQHRLNSSNLMVALMSSAQARLWASTTKR